MVLMRGCAVSKRNSKHKEMGRLVVQLVLLLSLLVSPIILTWDFKGDSGLSHTNQMANVQPVKDGAWMRLECRLQL